MMAWTRHTYDGISKKPSQSLLEDFPNEQNEDEGIQEEFLGMIHDSTVKASIEDESLEKLWGMMEKGYPKVAEKPLTLLTVFPSTYLCESAFSSVVAVETKAWNRSLDLDSICVELSQKSHPVFHRL